MIYLVDTNVLLRSIQQADPLHADAKRAGATLTRQDQQLSIVAQNLIEFWAVATRPAINNGLALSIDLTFNTNDFKRFSQIRVVNPLNVT